MPNIFYVTLLKISTNFNIRFSHPHHQACMFPWKYLGKKCFNYIEAEFYKLWTPALDFFFLYLVTVTENG